VRLVLAQK
jgi:hypothetical protein